MIPPVVAWSCAAVLLVLAVRSAARLLADRRDHERAADPGVPGCALTSRTGDAVHLATAAGMIAMLLPLGLPPLALVVYFSATTAFVGGSWLLRVTRRQLALHRGGTAACRPAHALEPHHAVVGLAMIVMAARMADSGPAGVMSGMAGMAGMVASSGWAGLGTLALIYVWAAVLVLGGGLAKAASARPAPTGTVAVLAAPITVYACELAMTVVMGLMLLG